MYQHSSDLGRRAPCKLFLFPKPSNRWLLKLNAEARPSVKGSQAVKCGSLQIATEKNKLQVALSFAQSFLPRGCPAVMMGSLS
jgi:hypothetical protein